VAYKEATKKHIVGSLHYETRSEEEVWIAKYRAALDQPSPRPSRYLRVREFITRIYRQVSSRITRNEAVKLQQRKPTVVARGAAQTTRTGARRIKRPTVAGKKAAQGVDRSPSRSKPLHASGK
jgi:hypothetical protein